jgi:hypothetical protein
MSTVRIVEVRGVGRDESKLDEGVRMYKSLQALKLDEGVQMYKLLPLIKLDIVFQMYKPLPALKFSGFRKNMIL